MMQLPDDAIISYSNSIKINAPLEKVWSFMADIDSWPEWNPDIRSATLLGDLHPGVKFKWKAGPGGIVSTLEAVEPGRIMAWRGKLPGVQAVHIWRIEHDGRSTVLTTEESWTGLVPRLLKSYSQATLQQAVDNGLKLLKQVAEK